MKWPVADKSALTKNILQIAVQVNGKLRAQIDVPSETTVEAIKNMAKQHENVRRFTEGLAIQKIIVIPNKLVNIVAI